MSESNAHLEDDPEFFEYREAIRLIPTDGETRILYALRDIGDGSCEFTVLLPNKNQKRTDTVGSGPHGGLTEGVSQADSDGTGRVSDSGWPFGGRLPDDHWALQSPPGGKITPTAQWTEIPSKITEANTTQGQSELLFKLGANTFCGSDQGALICAVDNKRLDPSTIVDAVTQEPENWSYHTCKFLLVSRQLPLGTAFNRILCPEFPRWRKDDPRWTSSGRQPPKKTDDNTWYDSDDDGEGESENAT